jgi:glutathione reductase (NADPH)
VAIHEAICFVETAFKDNPVSPDHDTIPTAVFSQPEIGTVGLSEEDAARQFERLEIYLARFRPMRSLFAGRPDRMMLKLVVDAKTRVVLGAHMLGPEAGEMAQLVGIAVKAQLTKDDFDRTMALHPTVAEELVTMYEASYRIENGQRVG